MPAPLLPRIQGLAALHNAMAEDWAETGGGGVSADEILRRLGLERKALYRLADELREAGAPLEYAPETRVWRYTQSWNFPVAFVHTMGGASGMRLALDCLLDPGLERGLSGQVLVDPALRPGRGGSTLPRLTGKFAPDLLGPLARAIKERRRVRFRYRKPHETVGSVRILEPLEIFEWNGMPYLQAREKGPGGDFKRFALSRIEGLEVLEETFRLPARASVPSCLGAFCGDLFEAEIAADARHAPFVRERQWHPRQTVRERPDGSVVFTLPFGHAEEAARWILGQGPGFRPLGPARLVKAWKDMVAALSRPARG